MTFIELLDRFPDDKAAEEWFVSIRWPDGIRCAHCNSDNVQEKTTHPRMPYRCRSCRKFFSARTGTVMTDSKIGYRKWIIGMYMMNSDLKGVSSMEVYRELGMTQKAAWHFLHRIRECWSIQSPLDSKAMEADEGYFGGKEANKHAKKKLRAGRGTVGKTAVAGARDRDSGQIAAQVVPDTKADTLQGFTKQHVKKGGTLYSDDSVAYDDFDYVTKHETVRHGVGEYVRGEAHVNGVESFWAMMKRGFHGTYHRMSPKHLQRYVDEFRGRHNTRDKDTIDQMAETARGMIGKRLQWRELTGR